MGVGYVSGEREVGEERERKRVGEGIYGGRGGKREEGKGKGKRGETWRRRNEEGDKKEDKRGNSEGGVVERERGRRIKEGKIE